MNRFGEFDGNRYELGDGLDGKELILLPTARSPCQCFDCQFSGLWIAQLPDDTEVDVDDLGMDDNVATKMTVYFGLGCRYQNSWHLYMRQKRA